MLLVYFFVLSALGIGPCTLRKHSRGFKVLGFWFRVWFHGLSNLFETHAYRKTLVAPKCLILDPNQPPNVGLRGLGFSVYMNPKEPIYIFRVRTCCCLLTV